MREVKATTHRSESRRGRAKRTIAHRLFATTRPVDPMFHDEDDYDQDAPKLSLSKVFLVILLLHVLVIFGLVVMSMEDKVEPALTGGGDEGEGRSSASLAIPRDEALAQRREERRTSDGPPVTGSLDAASANPSPNDRRVPLAPPGRREVQPPPEGWDTVEVRSGENIGDVARRVGVEQRWLVRGNLALNRLASESAAVRVGQVLAVPDEAAIETYLVEERLAARQAEGASSEPAAPVVTESDAIEAVAVAVKEPEAASVAEATPVEPEPVEAAPVEETTQPVAVTTTAEGDEHVVARGETFYRIALTHGVSVDLLMEANGYTDPGTLRVGDVLTIP